MRLSHTSLSIAKIRSSDNKNRIKYTYFGHFYLYRLKTTRFFRKVAFYYSKKIHNNNEYKLMKEPYTW